MLTSLSARLPRHAVPVAVFVAFWGLTAFFRQEPSANSIPRVATALKIWDRGELHIDEYQKLSVDKIYIDKHYYNDKAPLTSLVLLPLVALADVVGYLPGGEDLFARGRRVVKAHDLGVLLLVQVMFAAFAAMLFGELRRGGTSFALAWTGSAALSFGTFLFPMSSAYFGHIHAGFLLLLALLAWRSVPSRPFLSGLCCGLATSAEYPAALVGLAAFVDLLLHAREDFRGAFRKGLFFAGGVLVCGFGIGLHNLAVTGNALILPYQFVSEQTFVAMRTNYGFRSFSWQALWELLFGLHRGLFFYAPAFAVAILALVLDSKDKAAVRRGALPFLLFFSFLALISSYYMWNGGFSYGPRHLIPPVMLLSFQAARVLGRRPVLLRWASALGAAGLFMALAAQIVLPLPDDKTACPVFEAILPSLRSGSTLLGTRNPGSTLLLHPLGTLGLWLALFAAAGIGISRLDRVQAKAGQAFRAD